MNWQISKDIVVTQTIIEPFFSSKILTFDYVFISFYIDAHIVFL